jgi:hypothetical protein
MEQKISDTLDLKYRLRSVRELALKLHLAEQTLRTATQVITTAREQSELYLPEIGKSLPAAFQQTSEVLFAYHDCICKIRHGLQCLRERCFDTAVDFQNRLAPILVGPWVREFPRIGELPDLPPLPALETDDSDATDANDFLRNDFDSRHSESHELL